MECLTEQQLDEMTHSARGERTMADYWSHIALCANCARRLNEYKENMAMAGEVVQAFSASDLSLSDLNLSEFDSIDEPGSLDVRVPLAPGELPPKDSIPGYEIVREIHRGGQGVVYEAIQASTQRTVAVKVMLEGPFASERSRWRFEREVKLIAQLRHPNIVVIHDSGITQGRYYFVMDYVRGQPLDTHVRLADLDTQEILRLFVRICDSVNYAHRRGVIHRDLKPSNILVSEESGPQLLDFGLAKLIGERRQESHEVMATAEGQLLGTLQYMSPEQTVGDPEAIDTRTDVYTLGVILYQLLTRNVPYLTDVDLAEALDNIRNCDPVRPSRRNKSIRADLDAIIMQAIHKDPERRYDTAGDLADDLRAYLEGRPVTAKSDSSFYVIRRLATRHYFHTSVIAALLAAIIGFGGICFHAMLEAREKRDQLSTLKTWVELQNKNLLQQLSESHARQNEHLLGWFLTEWHAGRTDAARHIHQYLQPECPEYAAMSFLLNESQSASDLQSTFPPKAEALALFVIGERYLKQGKLIEAREVFREYVDIYSNVWSPLVEARLRQVEAALSDSSEQDESPKASDNVAGDT